MKICAIICEYNPFHNGHMYQIEQIRKTICPDRIIGIMSGNFVQRGEPAITDMYTRSKIAVDCGLDAVFELPLFFATGSAEFFARGAVSILNEMQITDLAFGAESTDIEAFNSIAELLLDEPEEYRLILNQTLCSGASFPVAREKAVTALLPKCSYLLKGSNNLLGIEYIKAIKQLESKIVPHIIKRSGNDFNDHVLSDIPSATSIRTFLRQNSAPDFSCLSNAMPENAYNILCSSYAKCFPVFFDDFSSMLYYKLTSESADSLSKYCDVTADLAARISSLKDDYFSFTDFIDKVSSKNYVYSRISRSLLHILLNIPSDIKPYFYKDALFTRILACKKESTDLLAYISEVSDIPVINKVTRSETMLSQTALSHFQTELTANSLYYYIIKNKYGFDLKTDKEHSPYFSSSESSNSSSTNPAGA